MRCNLSLQLVAARHSRLPAGRPCSYNTASAATCHAGHLKWCPATGAARLTSGPNRCLRTLQLMNDAQLEMLQCEELVRGYPVLSGRCAASAQLLHAQRICRMPPCMPSPSSAHWPAYRQAPFPAVLPCRR